MKELVLFSGLVISTYSYGQFAFGLKGGININQLSVSNSSGGNPYSTNMAFHFGLFGQLKLKEKLIFIPELQFTQRGANLQPDLRINLNYIELPVLISYRVIKQLN